MNKIKIAGVQIDLDSPDFKNKKTPDGLRSLDIFSHLPEDKQNEAYYLLAEEINKPPETLKEEGSPLVVEREETNED